jgi:hypothetical protein
MLDRCEVWEDVTTTQNASLHNRGIGAGRGAIATGD